MATILNQATLTYTYGDTTEQTLSNLASTEWNASLSLEKRTLESAYRAGADLTFLITLANDGTAAQNGLTLTDDLGAYTPEGGTSEVAPLTYTGPAELYLDGEYAETLTPTVGETGVTFPLPALPAGAHAMLLYKARVNGFAPLGADASITNTVSLTDTAELLSASATIPAEAYAAVTIEKEMTPNPIGDGSELSVTFTIENSGNTPATDLVLTDDFAVSLDNVSITVNGTPVTDFSFENNRLVLPQTGSALSTVSVPAAVFSQDPDTGAVTVTPGKTVIVLTGAV